jgi:outer membrane protein assembly factor BamB
MTTNKILIFFILTIITSSCSSNSFLGQNEKIPHTGKRESILLLDKKLHENSNLKNIKINIPKQSSNSSWTMSNINENVINNQNLSLDPNLKKTKTIRLEKFSSHSEFEQLAPIIHNNILYIINNHEAKAYNLENGKIIWSKKLLSSESSNKEIYGGGLFLDNNILYITSGQKDVLALNSENGEIMWQYHLSNIARSIPFVASGALYVIAIDNKLYAINKNNGSLIWMHEGSIEAISTIKSPSIAFSHDIVIVPYTSGDVFFLRAQDAAELMQVNLAFNQIIGQGFAIKDIDSTPLVNGDQVFLINNEGSILCINMLDGQILWKQEISGYKNIWLAGDFLYVTNDNGNIISLYKKTGEIKWVNQIDIDPKKQLTLHGPLMAGDRLIISLSNGDIHEISPYDGSNINVIHIDEKISNFPIIANSQLIALTSKGNLSFWQ